MITVLQLPRSSSSVMSWTAPARRSAALSISSTRTLQAGLSASLPCGAACIRGRTTAPARADRRR
jgi:hypothetical protein